MGWGKKGKKKLLQIVQKVCYLNAPVEDKEKQQQQQKNMLLQE